MIAVVIGAAAVAAFGDVRKLADQLDGFYWPAFGRALGFALANYAIRLARWEAYLRRQDVLVPRRSSFLVFGAGLSLSITPGKLGGLVTSAFLTLEVLPVLYTLWRHAQLRRARARGVPIAAIVGRPPPWARS